MGGCAWSPERIFPLYLGSVAGYTEMGEGVSPDFIPEVSQRIPLKCSWIESVEG